MSYIRDLHLGVTGRGENQPPPASYEPHATGCVFIHYLLRGMAIKKGQYQPEVHYMTRQSLKL
ncbi:MAG: hypothetical protein ACOCXH_11460 [Cyclobacteriaceae bacterium]